jgi:tRNA (cmo5U34)-methyltransferase
MSEFDARARDWDKNQRYVDRSEAVAKAMLQTIPFKKNMKALEYGSGTALLSFALKDQFEEIVLMDNSQEMTAVTAEKIASQNIQNMNPLFFDLEHQDYNGKFDVIYSQMVMHHVSDIDAMLTKFHGLLNPGGYLAIADLYAEDGSFHGEGFNGHKGFDVENLQNRVSSKGFIDLKFNQCFVISKITEDGSTKDYPLFLLVARSV